MSQPETDRPSSESSEPIDAHLRGLEENEEDQTPESLEEIEREAIAALEFVRSYRERHNWPADATLSAAEGEMSFAVPLKVIRAALAAVRLPNGDGKTLDDLYNLAPGPSSERTKLVAKLHRCRMTFFSDRIRVSNAHRGVRCEVEIPLRQVVTEVPAEGIALLIHSTRLRQLVSTGPGTAKGRHRGVPSLNESDEDQRLILDRAENVLWIESVTNGQSVRYPLPVELVDAMPALGEASELTFDPSVLHRAVRVVGKGKRAVKSGAVRVITVENGEARGGKSDFVSRYQAERLDGLKLSLSQHDRTAFHSLLGRLRTATGGVVGNQFRFGDGFLRAELDQPSYTFPSVEDPIQRVQAGRPALRLVQGMLDTRAAILGAILTELHRDADVMLKVDEVDGQPVLKLSASSPVGERVTTHILLVEPAKEGAGRNGSIKLSALLSVVDNSAPCSLELTLAESRGLFTARDDVGVAHHLFFYPLRHTAEGGRPLAPNPGLKGEPAAPEPIDR